MLARKILVAGLLALGAAGVAFAAGDGPARGKRGHGPMGHASVEFAAMHNIMAELLSAKTGKTPAEIAALFDAGGPHEVAEKLNLTHEDMKPLFKEARATLITRAQAANLITAAQAEKLRAAKIEMRHRRGPHPEGDEGDDK